MAGIDGLVIDRNQLTHRAAVRISVLGLTLQKAAQAMDAETFAQANAELDALIAPMVVAVPDGWLPDGVQVGDPDFLGALSQEHYAAIMEQANPN